jgi:serine/threonine protein phosphatase PrpC
MIPAPESAPLSIAFSPSQARKRSKEEVMVEEEMVSVPSITTVDTLSLSRTSTDLSTLDDTTVLVKALQQSFTDMDTYLEEDCIEIAGMSGSTFVVALVTPTTIFTAHVGDSRCVLYENGHVISMTHDHKPENEGERVRIEMAGGFVAMNRVNGELAMSRALGDFQYKCSALPAHQQAVVAYPEIAIHTRSARHVHYYDGITSTGLASPLLQPYQFHI